MSLFLHLRSFEEGEKDIEVETPDEPTIISDEEVASAKPSEESAEESPVWPDLPLPDRGSQIIKQIAIKFKDINNYLYYDKMYLVDY